VVDAAIQLDALEAVKLEGFPEPLRLPFDVDKGLGVLRTGHISRIFVPTSPEWLTSIHVGDGLIAINDDNVQHNTREEILYKLQSACDAARSESRPLTVTVRRSPLVSSPRRRVPHLEGPPVRLTTPPKAAISPQRDEELEVSPSPSHSIHAAASPVSSPVKSPAKVRPQEAQSTWLLPVAMMPLWLAAYVWMAVHYPLDWTSIDTVALQAVKWAMSTATAALNVMATCTVLFLIVAWACLGPMVASMLSQRGGLGFWLVGSIGLSVTATIWACAFTTDSWTYSELIKVPQLLDSRFAACIARWLGRFVVPVALAAPEPAGPWELSWWAAPMETHSSPSVSLPLWGSWVIMSARCVVIWLVTACFWPVTSVVMAM
jgi:hypothetical protein